MQFNRCYGKGRKLQRQMGKLQLRCGQRRGLEAVGINFQEEIQRQMEEQQVVAARHPGQFLGATGTYGSSGPTGACGSPGPIGTVGLQGRKSATYTSAASIRR